jgi:hypothetical protein
MNEQWDAAMSIMGREFTQAEQDAGWPTAMKPRQLAGLQRPWRKGDAQALHFCTRLLRRIEQACKDGLLLSATEDRPLTMQNKAFIAYKQRAFALSGTIDTSEPIFKTTTKTELKAVTVITAQAFAAWLAAPTQDETPSAHIAAWLEAVGAGVKPQPQHEAAPVPTATPLIEQPTIWTDKRKREARAMLEKLKGEGKRDFHKQTAEHYQVSPQRLRDVLRDSAAPAPKKARGQNSVFDVQPSKVHRIK